MEEESIRFIGLVIGIGIGVVLYYYFKHQFNKKDDNHTESEIIIKGNGNKVKW